MALPRRQPPNHQRGDAIPTYADALRKFHDDAHIHVEYQFSTGRFFIRTADGDEHEPRPIDITDRASIKRVFDAAAAVLGIEPDTTIKVWRVREQQTVTVPAWTTPTPGIVIHGKLNDAPDTYVVTHQRSGLMVAVTGCGCFTSSLSVAELLGECGDWDRSGEEIRLDDEMRGRARDLLQSLGVDAAAPPVDDRHAEVRAEAMRR